MGCGRVAGVLVASFFGPLHRGLDHNLRVSLHVLVSTDAGELWGTKINLLIRPRVTLLLTFKLKVASFTGHCTQHNVRWSSCLSCLSYLCECLAGTPALSCWNRDGKDYVQVWTCLLRNVPSVRCEKEGHNFVSWTFSFCCLEFVLSHAVNGAKVLVLRQLLQAGLSFVSLCNDGLSQYTTGVSLRHRSWGFLLFAPPPCQCCPCLFFLSLVPTVKLAVFLFERWHTQSGIKVHWLLKCHAASYLCGMAGFHFVVYSPCGAV